ncbi:zinc-ribbon domain containing protein [Haloferula luteola]|uniref:zinc-ribbon domain containing protein n=1 Tax=Haloferula luteola TaxID=595692 RepID=UPI003CCD9A69
MGVPTWRGHVYLDFRFTYRACGSQGCWKAKDQMWWDEEIAGEMESIAVMCRACRRNERERVEEARRVSLEGSEKKRRRRAEQADAR